MLGMLSYSLSGLTVEQNLLIDGDKNLNDATEERIIKMYPHDCSLRYDSQILHE